MALSRWATPNPQDDTKAFLVALRKIVSGAEEFRGSSAGLTETGIQLVENHFAVLVSLRDAVSYAEEKIDDPAVGYASLKDASDALAKQLAEAIPISSEGGDPWKPRVRQKNSQIMSQYNLHREVGANGLNDVDNLAGYVCILAQAKVKQIQQKPLLRKPFLKFGECLRLWSHSFVVGALKSAKHANNYARILAQARVEQVQQKPLSGKPYLPFGQCLHLWSYSFVVGGVLSAKHANNLDEFGSAFLGVRGERGEVQCFFTDVAQRIIHSLNQAPTIFHYIINVSMKRSNHSWDGVDLLQKLTGEIESVNAVEVSKHYAGVGSAFGAIYPKEFREIFERTDEDVPREVWEEARAAGLDIPHEPTRLSYEDVEETENEEFLAYCRECCPDLYAVLNQ